MLAVPSTITGAKRSASYTDLPAKDAVDIA